MDKNLLGFLQSETAFESLGNEKAIIQNPSFAGEIGKALKGGNPIDFTKELGEELEYIDVYKACIVTNFMGFICEKTDCTEAGNSVIEFFGKACNLVKKFFEFNTDSDGNINMPDDMRKMYNEHKECVMAFYGFNILCISAMAFLSRDFECRKILRSLNIKDTLEFLSLDAPESQYLDSVFYVNRIHDTCGKTPLLVLDTEKRQGFYAEVNDVENCFHLLYLLEEEIYNNLCDKYGMNSYKPDSDLSEVAHAKSWDYQNNQSANAFFFECNYHQICDKNGVNMLWGEMPPECIPSIDGYHIISLYRQGISRSFTAGFLAVGHSALNPYVKIQRELSSDEYNEWEEKIKVKK